MLNSKFKIQNLRFKIRYLFAALCVFNFVFLISCSIPNLEKLECTEARNDVREFYSFHFGNDLKPSAENLKQRERFLSGNLKAQLARQPVTNVDYFTQTDDYPKAFRIGRCEVISPEKTVLEVLLFWKTETRSEQRAVKVEAVKENNQWLIDKVESK